jgi:hypothetical protein
LSVSGFFANEPDFPTAFGLYRTAVERGDPAPVEWEWLSEIDQRILDGKPPATEVEYRELAEWYMRNEAVVYRANIRFALQNTYNGGPRRLGSTETVEALRMLRAGHPELT